MDHLSNRNNIQWLTLLYLSGLLQKQRARLVNNEGREHSASIPTLPETTFPVLRQLEVVKAYLEEIVQNRRAFRKMPVKYEDIVSSMCDSVPRSLKTSGDLTQG